MTRIGSVFFFVIFFFFLIAEAKTTVQSSVDRNEMSMGDSFTFTVSVISSDEVEIQEPRLPNMNEFDLLNSWPSTAISKKLVQTDQGMQFETQVRKDFHFMLSPKMTGNLSISSAEVVVSGKAYRTQPIVITVQKDAGGSKGNQRKKQPQQNPRGGFPRMPRGFDDSTENAENPDEEMFNQILRQRQQMMEQLQQQMQQQQMPPGGGFPQEDSNQGSGNPSLGMSKPAFKSLPTNENDAFFISVELDKTEVYEGEQVTANWYVYTRGQMETFDRLKFPDLKGFWKEVIEEVPAIQFRQEIVNGIPWKKALLASHALFPIKAGTAMVDEYKVKSRVRLLSQGYGYSGKIYEFTKTSSRVPIKVKPLPVEGRPSDYTGAVGQFELNDSVEKQSVMVNEPFTLKVRFEGLGNAKLIELPAMALPNQLEQYDSKSDSKFFKNGRSYKEFEVLLIPRQEGDFKIPALSVSMFDPATSKYYTRRTQEIVMKAVNNPNAAVGPSSRMPEIDKKSAARGSELPDVIMAWQPSAEGRILSSSVFWAVIYFGILMIFVLKARRLFGWGHRQRTLKDLIQKRIKNLDQAVLQKDFRKVGAEMTNVFYIVLSHLAGEKSVEGGASQKVENLLEMMPPSLRRDYGTKILKFFDIFQTLSFAPEEMLGSLKSSESMVSNVDEAKKMIADLISSLSEGNKNS